MLGMLTCLNGLTFQDWTSRRRLPRNFVVLRTKEVRSARQNLLLAV